MSNLVIDELRSNLRTHLQGMDSGATAVEIIADFRVKHTHSIDKARRALEDIGLIKLLNDVGTRLPSRGEQQPDLFAGFSIPASICIPSNGKDRRGVHTPIAKATIGEVEAWIEVHTKPRLSRTPRVIELQRLMEHIKPFAVSSAVTIEDALSAARCESQQLAS